MSFPSWSHVVGRSGTSFSGARAECPCSHEQPHTSVKRHQDRDAGAISEMLFFNFQSLKTRMKGQSGWRRPVSEHTLTFETLKSCSHWWVADMMERPVVFRENYSWGGKEITTL